MDIGAAVNKHWSAGGERPASPSGSSTAALLGIGAREDERPVIPTTYVDDLREHERLAHLVLASLRSEYHRAGEHQEWYQHLAVAVLDEGEGRTGLVFATSDGLSVIPADVALPHGVTPLADHPARPDLALAGYTDPTVKLAVLPGIVALVSTAEGANTGTHQTVEQANELLDAEVTPSCSIPRGEWVEPSSAAELLGQAVALHKNLDPEHDAHTLRGLRWFGDAQQPPSYLPIFSRWLAGEAVVAYERGDHGAAAWLAQQAIEAGGAA
ncbi:GIY-YIG nuclease family protein [Mycolicibacillus koreensis]|uniref:GIY-YIG nuclease family protein n=1 Tax=Mycolicibacillus koreensis TaxID=1069220 RepID=UPI001C554537|nr:GIY-YIG nuclease family protein [Mycolicibacillus koreensis]